MYVLNGCSQLQDIHTSFAIYSQGKLQGYLHSGEVGERCMQQVFQNRVQESYLDPSGWCKNCYWMRMEHDRNLHALHLANVLRVNMFIKLDFKDFPQNPILLRKRLVPLQVFANNKHGSCSMYGRKCIWCSMWCDLAACQGNDFYEHMDVCVCLCTHVSTWVWARLGLWWNISSVRGLPLFWIRPVHGLDVWNTLLESFA